MTTLLERAPRLLFSLPTFMYAAGCLGSTEDMVEMAPEGIPMVHALVLALGASLLAAGTLFHTQKYGRSAAFAIAVLMVVTALSIHLPGFFKAYPPELGEAMTELQQRMSMSGVIKDLGLAGAALIVARMDALRRA